MKLGQPSVVGKPSEGKTTEHGSRREVDATSTCVDDEEDAAAGFRSGNHEGSLKPSWHRKNLHRKGPTQTQRRTAWCDVNA